MTALPDPMAGLAMQPKFKQLILDVQRIFGEHVDRTFMTEGWARCIAFKKPMDEKEFADRWVAVMELSQKYYVTKGKLRTKIWIYPIKCKHCGDIRYENHSTAAKCLFGPTMFEEEDL